MAWRPHGHVRVNARDPAAAGVCDRCSRMFNLRELRFQWDWTGARLQNLRILVCMDCYDTPNEQLRARILSPDPVPVFNPRPEPFYPSGVGSEQTAYITVDQTGAMLITNDYQDLITINGTNIGGGAPFPPIVQGPTPWFFIF